MSKNKEVRFSDFNEPSDIVVQMARMLPPGASVIDLGAGQGRNALYLASKGFDVTAVEREDSEVKIMNKKNSKAKRKIKIVQADIHEFAPDKQYDAVISNTVLHFFSPEEVVESIQKMKQATKQKGYNLITAYSDKNPPGKRSYLFKHNELLEFYRDWEIIVYEEKPTPWFVFPKGTKQRRNEAVYLITRKVNRDKIQRK